MFARFAVRLPNETKTPRPQRFLKFDLFFSREELRATAPTPQDKIAHLPPVNVKESSTVDTFDNAAVAHAPHASGGRRHTEILLLVGAISSDGSLLGNGSFLKSHASEGIAMALVAPFGRDCAVEIPSKRHPPLRVRYIGSLGSSRSHASESLVSRQSASDQLSRQTAPGTS